MRNSWIPTLRRFARRTLIAFPLLLSTAACYAQGCALCYTQAASSGARIIQGLRSGILVLVIPPMFMSVGITVLAYKKRNQFNRNHSTHLDRDQADW